MSKLAIVGLGKMGGNMAQRLSRAGINLVVYDQDQVTTDRVAAESGAQGVTSLQELLEAHASPRQIWLMLPSGVTESTIEMLKPLLKAGDTLIDGGNSHYKQTLRRATELKTAGINYVDVGVSGGIWGEKNGYALMIGGPATPVSNLEPVFRALAPAPDKGWLHCGPSGSGHFVKMVHNGIEYGMMQAFAEGFSLMENKKEFELNLGQISEMWCHGSVIRSWLLELTRDFLTSDTDLSTIAPVVADTGEGRWSAIEGIEQGVPAPVITTALISRFNSQGRDDFGARLLSLMRKGFGGHAVKKS